MSVIIEYLSFAILFFVFFIFFILFVIILIKIIPKKERFTAVEHAMGTLKKLGISPKENEELGSPKEFMKFIKEFKKSKNNPVVKLLNKGK